MSAHEQARAILADIRIGPDQAAQLRDTFGYLMRDVPPSDKTKRALRLAMLEWCRSLDDVGDEEQSLAELQERVLEGLAPVQMTAGGTFDPDQVWGQISHFIEALLQQARASTEAKAFATAVVATSAIHLDSSAGSAFVSAMVAVICMSIWRRPIAKHTILFLAANPNGTDRLALDQEARSIQVELERSSWRDRFEFVTRWAAEPLDLIRELRKLRPTVVHFSGHGGHDGATGRHGPVALRDVADTIDADPDSACPGLYFQSADGSPQFVSGAALRDAFAAAGASVKLVVLNACYSEAAAQALLANVDCVVGMAGSIRDDTARSFAIGFYGGLGERESVDAAHKDGCAAVGLNGFPDADRPRLKVRRAVDPGSMILAVLTPSQPEV